MYEGTAKNQRITILKNAAGSIYAAT